MSVEIRQLVFLKYKIRDSNYTQKVEQSLASGVVGRGKGHLQLFFGCTQLFLPRAARSQTITHFPSFLKGRYLLLIQTALDSILILIPQLTVRTINLS